MLGRYLWLMVWPSALILDYGLPRALSVRDVLAWHERLRPPLPTEDVAVPQVELVAAVVFGPA